MDKDVGRAASPNRLSSSTEPQERLGPPGFDPARGEARIWGYARALKKALIHIAPKDFRMEWGGFGDNQTIAVSCTIHTLHEAEAVCEIIMRLAGSSLSSRREAVRGDIYPDEPEPSFKEELEAMLGPCVNLTRDRDVSLAEDALARLSPEGVAARAEGIAQTPDQGPPS